MSEPGFFNDDGGAEDFVLPGDDEMLAKMRDQNAETAEVEPVPDPETPPEPETPVEPDTDTTEAEPEQQELEPAAEAAPEPELILGKFKTPEDLAAAYQALESLQGRQTGELGELRRTVEEIRAQTTPQPQQYDAEAVADHFAENPTAILPTIRDAYERGDMNLVWLGVHALSETDPVGAETLRAEIATRAAEARMAERIAPMQQQAATTQMQAGISQLTTKYPDIHEFIQGDTFAELAAGNVFVKRALTEGTPDEAVSAIETVYLIHRGRVSDNLDETVRDVARAAAEEGQTMREEAFVASATATTATPRKSLADEYAAGWDDKKDLFENGWKLT